MAGCLLIHVNKRKNSDKWEKGRELLVNILPLDELLSGRKQYGPI
jgi:hypothetical protein